MLSVLVPFLGGIIMALKMGKKNWIMLLAGAAAAEGLRVVAKSKKTREIAVKGLAKGMQVSDCVKANVENLKEDAQDLYAEAQQQKNAESCEDCCSSEE